MPVHEFSSPARLALDAGVARLDAGTPATLDHRFERAWHGGFIWSGWLEVGPSPYATDGSSTFDWNRDCWFGGAASGAWTFGVDGSGVSPRSTGLVAAVEAGWPDAG